MKSWKILAVDDDADVLKSLVYTLEDLVILDRGMEITTAMSAAEAEAILETQRDFAVLIIDVSMEKPNAGLTLVDRVRNRYGMDVARILLRTGQPGDLMQKTAVSKHEINDYIEKSTSDRWRIENSVLTALRAYVQLDSYKRLKNGLTHVLGFTTKALVNEQLTTIANAVVEHTEMIFGRKIGVAMGFQGKSTSFGEVALTILASSSVADAPPAEPLGSVIPTGEGWCHPVKNRMQNALRVGEDVVSQNSKVLLFQPSFNRSIALWLCDPAGFDTTDFQVIDFFNSTLRGVLERWALLRDRMIETSVSMGILAHEFRTPIASLRMTCEFFQDGLQSGDLDRDAATGLLSNAEAILDKMSAHINRSIDNVRVVVKPSVMVTSTKADVGELVAKTLQLHHMVIAEVGAVHSSIEPDAVAMVDAPILEQVVVNLLSNSAKAVQARKDKAAGPQISVAVKVLPNVVSITIQDQGVGMSADKLQRIFDPFFSSNEMPSHGLGLTMVKKSLEAMGGEISCQSVLGQGTTFRIELPLVSR